MNSTLVLFKTTEIQNKMISIKILKYGKYMHSLIDTYLLTIIQHISKIK